MRKTVWWCVLLIVFSVWSTCFWYQAYNGEAWLLDDLLTSIGEHPDAWEDVTIGNNNGLSFHKDLYCKRETRGSPCSL